MATIVGIMPTSNGMSSWLYRILEALTLSKNVMGLSAQALLSAGREQVAGDKLHFELASLIVCV